MSKHLNTVILLLNGEGSVLCLNAQNAIIKPLICHQSASVKMSIGVIINARTLPAVTGFVQQRALIIPSRHLPKSTKVWYWNAYKKCHRMNAKPYLPLLNNLRWGHYV